MLTDDEIAQLWPTAFVLPASQRKKLIAFARAVEAAERERCASVVRYWLTGHEPATGTHEARCLAHVLDGRQAPSGWTERA